MRLGDWTEVDPCPCIARSLWESKVFVPHLLASYLNAARNPKPFSFFFAISFFFCGPVVSNSIAVNGDALPDHSSPATRCRGGWPKLYWRWASSLLLGFASSTIGRAGILRRRYPLQARFVNRSERTQPQRACRTAGAVAERAPLLDGATHM